MVAERVGAPLHGMMARGEAVAAQATSAAGPQPVQVGQAALAQITFRTGETAAIGTWIVEVDDRYMAGVLLVVVRGVEAGELCLGSFVKGGGRTVDVLYHVLDVTGARVHVVMVEVGIGTHGRRRSGPRGTTI